MASDYKKEFDDLVSLMIKEDASDLHLGEGRQPVLRVSGFLIPIANHPVLSRQDIKGILDQVLSPTKKEIFLDKKEVDFAYDHNNSSRFRGNAFFQLNKISVAFRLIPKKIKSLEELKLPTILESFINKQQGFFLVVGPTGQGKSTTLATLIDLSLIHI